MPTNVVMPQLGESVVEGTVSKWLKNEGDQLHEFEPLVEISTDKVDTEIPAPASGTLLKILIPAGETVEKGTLLAVIGQAGEQVDTPSTNGSSHATHEPAPPAEATPSVSHASPVTSQMGHVTPVVARMVAEHNLDLSQIKGTGREGRVTKKDVEQYLENRHVSSSAEDDLPPWERPGTGDLFKSTVDYEDDLSAPPVVTSQPTTPTAITSVARVHPVEPIPEGAEGELVALSPMRKSIAEHMVRSKHTSPHVTTVFEVDLSSVMAHRQANKADFAKWGINLTLTAYFVAATVTALQAVPIMNSRWTEQGIYLAHQLNIGMAVALDQGLIVPVIKNAERMNLLGLAQTINDLATRARAKQLKPDEIQGGTFSITNHGVSGSLFATPIINQPQAAILGIGMLEKRVKVITDANGHDMIAIRPCVYTSLTFDHRIADGASGDAFLQTLKHTLENWT